MKKVLILVVTMATGFVMQAQGINFGIKAGTNFSNFNGDLDTDGITSFHAGAVLELNIVPTFSVQAEGLFSSQGATVNDRVNVGEAFVESSEDFNLNYIAVPLMAKYYILPSKLSLMAGPQFSFLVDEAEEALESKSFDMAAAGGVELKIIAGLFAQARYTIGLTDVYEDVDSKNAVFQLSVGYYF
ncbi:PorT family protein [Flavobacterium salilacus subsp. salilacus]|uniref:porin family protein n=1 Tax=Flavobacterium TaxID=237 RepID=UPI00107579A8|nr:MULTISPECIES: porin family protein [Flavobacterium]KAF2518518.1 PorT family protein [Flavobacterium salilacus subsp. salilacus]MBE1615160.1 PorT family protein [Flavobacterium sp. SaA2.13]NDI98149.1 PorT family protein [Flavobacterium salilacus subsp. altitudinum]